MAWRKRSLIKIKNVLNKKHKKTVCGPKPSKCGRLWRIWATHCSPLLFLVKCGTFETFLSTLARLASSCDLMSLGHVLCPHLIYNMTWISYKAKRISIRVNELVPRLISELHLGWNSLHVSNLFNSFKIS